MKKLVALYLIIFFCVSCEKTTDTTQIDLNADANILDGYFVTSIAFDKEGTAWIGTFMQGLIKYDSCRVTVFDHTNSIIPDSVVIYDIAIDSKSNIWFSCHGLMKYDGQVFTHYNSQNTPMPEDFVESIAIDSKDKIWFTSCRFRKGGVVEYDGINWHIYTPENSSLPVHAVKSIAIDQNDRVWFALAEKVNDACLVRIDNNEWNIYTDDDLGFSPYYFGNICINRENKVYGCIDYSLSSAITNSGPQVFIFDGQTSEQLYYDSILNISCITVDSDNNIWCGSSGSLLKYDGKIWTVDDSLYRESSIFAIEQANNEEIWIGTGEGINILKKD